MDLLNDALKNNFIKRTLLDEVKVDKKHLRSDIYKFIND